MLHQISIFIENKPGTLHETLGIIKQENLQIVASSISDTAEYGIYRHQLRKEQRHELH